MHVFIYLQENNCFKSGKIKFTKTSRVFKRCNTCNLNCNLSWENVLNCWLSDVTTKYVWRSSTCVPWELVLLIGTGYDRKRRDLFPAESQLYPFTVPEFTSLHCLGCNQEKGRQNYNSLLHLFCKVSTRYLCHLLSIVWATPFDFIRVHRQEGAEPFFSQVEMLLTIIMP